MKMRRMATRRPQLAPHHPPHVMPHLLAAIITVLSSAAVVVEAVFQGTQVPTNTLLYNATVSLSQSIIYKGQPGVRMACSGTFVDLGGDAATSLVLTAGHCFEGPGAGGSVAGMELIRPRFGGSTGLDLLGYDVVAKAVDVQHIFTGQTETSVDVALMKVAVEPGMQDAVREIPVRFGGAAPAAGDMHTLAGFGDDACTHSGEPQGDDQGKSPHCATAGAPTGGGAVTVPGDVSPLVIDGMQMSRGRGKLRSASLKLEEVKVGTNYQLFVYPVFNNVGVDFGIRSGDSGGPCL